MGRKNLQAPNNFSSLYTEEEIASLINSFALSSKAVNLEEIVPEKDSHILKKLLSLMQKHPRFIVISSLPKSESPRFLPKQFVIKYFLWANFRLAQLNIDCLKTKNVEKWFLNGLVNQLSEKDSKKILRLLATYNLIEIGKDKAIYFPFADIYFKFYSQIDEAFFDVFLEFVENYSNKTNKFELEINRCFDVFPNKGKFRVNKKRNQKIIKLRFGLDDGKEKTLEEIGQKFCLTRERVRQVLNFFEKNIKYSGIYKENLIKAFLYLLKNSKRKRIFYKGDQKLYPRLKMIANLLNLELEKIEKFSFRYLAINKKKSKDFSNFLSNLFCSTDISNLRETLLSTNSFFLGRTDREFLANILIEKKSKTLKQPYWIEKALRKIGRPAHYTEIAACCNSLCLDLDFTPRNVLAVLTRDGNLPWVWTGKKGYYALKEWGFKKPKIGIVTCVTNIVKKIYTETKKPVHINKIKQEILKQGRLFTKGSLYFACYKNPKISELKKDFFIPREVSKTNKEEEVESKITLEKLDQAISTLSCFSEK